MQRSTLSFVLALVLAPMGCSSSPPRGSAVVARPIAVGSASSAPRVIDSAAVPPSDTESPTDPALAVAPLEVESPMPLPPTGVTCAVRGHSEPFPDSCKERIIVAHEKREGGRPVARVRLTDLDITWGLFENPGRSWLHVDSAGFSLEAFADTTKELFVLGREVTAIADHVWLKANSGVYVRAKERTVSVTLNGDLPGTETFAALADCDAIQYDVPKSSAPSTPTVEAPPPKGKSMVPRGRSLSVSTEPAGPVHLLSSRSNEPLTLDLTVIDVRDAYSRVLFETDHARFDVWVPTRQIGEIGRGFGSGGMGLCGGSHDYIGENLFEVLADAPVLVGKTPTNAVTGVLTVRKTRPFMVRRHEGGYVEVIPFMSAIFPPDGQSYWLPEPIAVPRSH